ALLALDAVLVDDAALVGAVPDRPARAGAAAGGILDEHQAGGLAGVAVETGGRVAGRGGARRRAGGGGHARAAAAWVGAAAVARGLGPEIRVGGATGSGAERQEQEGEANAVGRSHGTQMLPKHMNHAFTMTDFSRLSRSGGRPWTAASAPWAPGIRGRA